MFTHFNEVVYDVTNKEYDIVAVYETFLKPRMPSASFHIEGYNLIRDDRLDREGGGVAIYLKNNLSYNILHTSSSDNSSEFLIIQVNLLNEKLLFGVIYRPPKSPYPADFFNTISNFLPSFKHVIITGDLNSNMIFPNSYSTPIFKFIDNNSLHLVQSDTTCHKPYSDTWLDIFIVSCEDHILSYSKTDSPPFDCHDALELKYKINKPDLNKSSNLKRCFKKFNLNLFHNVLSNQLISTSPLSITDKCRHLNNSLNNSLNHCAPKVEIYVGPRRKPWANIEIRKLIKKRNKIFSKAKRSGSQTLFEIYRQLRSEIKNKLDSAKNKHFARILDSSVNSKQLWSNLKSYGISSKPRPSPFTFFAPDEISKFFSSISSTHSAIDNTKLNKILSLDLKFEYPTFELSEISCNETLNTINSIKSKAKGYDGFSAQDLNLMNDHGIRLLTDIFNSSIKDCVFPGDWKRTLILPLLKTNSPSSMSDLRPIALISAFAKVFEKLIMKQLNKYMCDHSLISSNQYGYRSGYGTEACLLKLVGDINNAIDRKMLTVVILFDLSKAFDNVNHTILLEKMKRLNFSNSFIKWLYSYLSNRVISVTDGSNQLSTWHGITCGVPQGSVIGPLLYILYANDSQKCTKFTKMISYVDDTQIYLHRHPKDLNNGLKNIEADANSFVKWCNLNGFKVNLRKTMAIMFGTQKALTGLDMSSSNIIVDGIRINFVNEAKNLGIWFDRCMTWKTHVNKTINRISSVLYSLKLHKHSLSSDLKKN